MTHDIEERDKLTESVKDLEHALSFLPKAKKEPFFYAGISKNFEVCLEYAWKYLKRKCVEEGVDVYSPKETLRAAGRLNFIDDVEKWFSFLKDRNLAVHDYLGISDEDYLKTIQEFLAEVKKLS
jgi:nucleotidyltransferase substrate binding protein (TIGR01987 family)